MIVAEKGRIAQIGSRPPKTNGIFLEVPEHNVARPAKDPAHCARDVLMIDCHTIAARLQRLRADATFAVLRIDQILKRLFSETIFAESVPLTP